MNIKQLFNDDSAVSPVIGVILMVAITVILAAVIGTFVLGLGSNIESSPTAQFSLDYSGTFDGSTSGASITVTHDGGDSIDKSALSIISSGTTVYENGEVTADYAIDGNNWPTSVSSATSVTIEETGAATLGSTGDDVSVVWSSSSGETTQTLATGTLP